MTNKSVANSVKKRGDYTSTAAKVTVRKAVADLGDQLQDILDKTSYEDKTYSDFSDVVKKDTSPFFTQNMASKSSGLTKLEGDAHTKFNSYSLYNSDDVLKTPSEFVDEYKKSYKLQTLQIRTIMIKKSAVNMPTTVFRLRKKQLGKKIFLFRKNITVLRMMQLISVFHLNIFLIKKMYSSAIATIIQSDMNLTIM
mgnify:FL=1